MLNELSPIVLFVYNRPWHTRQTIEALAQNEFAKASELYIYSDAPKSKDAEDKVMEVRQYIKGITSFKQVHIIERPENFGLARSIIEGVSEVLKKHEKVIVLEDDIITSPHFLRFMNESLELYKRELKVMHVSGYIYPAKGVNYPDLFLWRVVSSWGWGTWRDRWKEMITDASYLYSRLKELKKVDQFDIHSYGFFTNQLLNNVHGKKHTWAVKWQASVFLKDGLALNPGKPLVRNIGFGEEATNTTFGNNAFEQQSIDPNYKVEVRMIPIKESLEISKGISSYFWARSHNELLLGLYFKIKSFITYHLRTLFQ